MKYLKISDPEIINRKAQSLCGSVFSTKTSETSPIFSHTETEKVNRFYARALSKKGGNSARRGPAISCRDA
jgi:hypothetical protein